MNLSSPSFEHNGVIPQKFTCNGKNISPPLEWSFIPVGTQSFVLIMDDPDIPKNNNAGIAEWDHWVLYNIPSHIRSLEEGGTLFPPGVQKGLTTWGKTEYGGPCPPDREHRYFFKLYALDALLKFEKTPTKHDLYNAMIGHILEEAILIGRYNQPHNKHT